MTPPLDVRHARDGDTVRVELRGELSADSGPELSDFWARNLADSATIDLSLEAVDAADAGAVTVFVTLVRDALADGRRVVLRHAPQIVAHNLYRAHLLGNPRLELVEPRAEEPYGG